MLDAVLGADPGLTRPLPPSQVLADFVLPFVFAVRDHGDGNLRQLPLLGTPAWCRASDAEKWAVVATLALQGVWAGERNPDERIAYCESGDRVDSLLDWGVEAYRQGFTAGRRHQAARARKGVA
ncbi:hypothetical protein QT969_20835 [Rhodococcus sp. CSLK01-03]|uniref:Uncharacterized protein n=1 Tax=Rhodococcus indonesiensis TaxID=3055869 RepID=A0ABT7RSY5_9NOCA|nr:hypothetical protein [Rhodococcus indonesiensis]MDM7490737.1 hypothetical protein [Rhodococcus indonesiensis]